MPIVTAPAGSRTPVPVPDPDLGWSPPVRQWYESLSRSSQSAYYQASDWTTALVLAELLHRALAQGARPSAGLVQAWASGASELLTTVAARRRVRMELERSAEVDQGC